MVFSLNQILNVSLDLQLQFISKISPTYLTFFFGDVKKHEFPLTVPNRTSNLGKIFLYIHLSFTAAYNLKSEKNWPVDFAKL